jgi:hypothetical protein
MSRQAADPEQRLLHGAPSAALERAITGGMLALGIAGLASMAWAVALRLGSRWPLEWMEMGIVHHAARLARGLPIYDAPTSEFIAYLYPPLGYVPLALVHLLAGPSLPWLRAACVLGSLLALAGIARMGARAAGSTSAGLLAAGVFAFGYGYTGAFLDIVRIDAFFVAMLVWGAERLQAGRERTGLWLLASSFFVKQHGLVCFAAAAGAVLLRDRRRALPVVLPPALGLGAGVVALALHGEWFLRYVFELPASHGLIPRLLLSFLLVDLLLVLPLPTVGAFYWLRARRRWLSPLGALLIASVVVSALGRAHAGGHDNVRLPGFALLCGRGHAPLLGWIARAGTRALLRLAALALVALQCALLLSLWGGPHAHAPTPQSDARFAHLQAELRRCAAGGRAVALDFPLLTGVPFMHTMALSDLRMGDAPRLSEIGSRALIDALFGPRAPAAVAVGATFPELADTLATHYRPCAHAKSPHFATGYSPPDQVIHVRDARARAE